MSSITSTVVRAAAQLNISATATTTGVPCLGARQVTFRVVGTNASTLANTCNVEVSMDNTNWVAVSSNAALATVGTIDTAALNAGGRQMTVVPSSVLAPYIAWKYARLSCVNNAAALTGLAVTAYVLADEMGESIVQPFPN